jgi:biopolymer transport protein ExbB
MKLTLFVMVIVVACGVKAADLDGLAGSASNDLQQALAELAAVRQEIESERLPLVRQQNELEQRLADRKTALAKAQRAHENQLVELNALKAEAKQRADEVKYIDSLLSEYARAFRSRLAFAEEPRYAATLEAVDQAAAAPDLTAAERFERRWPLLIASLERIDAALGGVTFDGRALDSQGVLQSGRVALIGPVAIFASASGDLTGLLQQELNKADPTVVRLDKGLAASCRALVTTGSGQLAFDPTLGNAFKLTALKESLFEKIAKGGWVMAPLITLGFAALIVALLKWVQLARIRLAREADLQTVLRHLENGERQKALAHARALTGPAGELLATAVEHADEKKEYIEEILYEKMLGVRTRLERGIAFLALTATAGPLMGLLGTVMGMIATFKLISSFGSGDPRLLAAGISEALIATATGMTVAIPALLLHAFLSRKAKSVIGSLEQTAVGFINGVPETAKATYA